MKTIIIKSIRKSQAGFTHVLLPVLAATVIVAIGLVGYKIHQTSSAANISGASVCGSGYVLKGKVQLSDSKSKRAAWLQLYNNKAQKKMCAINMSATSSYGKSKYMSVTVDLINKSSEVIRKGDRDKGIYSKYAGPVYVSYAGLSCDYGVFANAVMKYKGVTSSAPLTPWCGS